MTTTRDVIACARQCIGARFVHQGRCVDGLDCLGLLIVISQSLGLHFHGHAANELDVPEYGMRPDVALLKRKLDDYLVPIPRQEVQEADIVLLKIDGSPQHLALLSDYPMPNELGMIHAYAPARKVVEHRYDSHWRLHTYSAYRLPQFVQKL
jgi:hypothetical protein